MMNDPQLDVDEAPSGQVYDIGDMVTDVDGRLLVVEDAHCVSSFDCEDPNNWDYVCVDKDLNEFFVSYGGISHKANHLRLHSDLLRCKKK